MLLSERVAAGPNAVAITAGRTNITWIELQRRARRVASALVRDGVGVQARVAYLGKNDARYFELLFGCGLAAAVLAPLNWRLAPAELEAILIDSGASLLFVDPDVSGPDVRGGAVRVVELSSGYEAWLGPAEDPAIPAEPEHVAFQLYTSGTTGRPKGAMFANGSNLRVLTEDIAGAWFESGDVSLVAMPLFHMGGLAWALSGMASGVQNVIVRDFVSADVLDTIVA